MKRRKVTVPRPPEGNNVCPQTFYSSKTCGTVTPMIRIWPSSALCCRLSMAQRVSKLKIIRLLGVSLPLPSCREADIERSDKAFFALSQSGVRFDTVWPDGDWPWPPTADLRFSPQLTFASCMRAYIQQRCEQQDPSSRTCFDSNDVGQSAACDPRRCERAPSP